MAGWLAGIPPIAFLGLGIVELLRAKKWCLTSPLDKSISFCIEVPKVICTQFISGHTLYPWISPILLALPWQRLLNFVCLLGDTLNNIKYHISATKQHLLPVLVCRPTESIMGYRVVKLWLSSKVNFEVKGQGQTHKKDFFIMIFHKNSLANHIQRMIT